MGKEHPTVNHITSLQAQIIAQNAELQAIRDGLSSLVAYVTSAKFHITAFSTDVDMAGYVNTDDIVLRINEIKRRAQDAESTAYMNELGPPVAIGGCTNNSRATCTHGRRPCDCGARHDPDAFHGSFCARYKGWQGWHCPSCGIDIPGYPFDSSEAKAQEWMRQHWRATHRVNPASEPF